MDEEISMRGNTDKPNVHEMYNSDQEAPVVFAQTEDELRAHMVQMEAEDLARAKAWTLAQSKLKLEQATLAEAEAARAQMPERKPIQTLQPIKQPGFAMKLASLVRSFFPSAGHRKAA
jgi:hypothetical protein